MNQEGQQHSAWATGTGLLSADFQSAKARLPQKGLVAESISAAGVSTKLCFGSATICDPGK